MSCSGRGRCAAPDGWQRPPARAAWPSPFPGGARPPAPSCAALPFRFGAWAPLSPPGQKREVFHSRSGKAGVVREDIEGVVATTFTHYDARGGPSVPRPRSGGQPGPFGLRRGVAHARLTRPVQERGRSPRRRSPSHMISAVSGAKTYCNQMRE